MLTKTITAASFAIALLATPTLALAQDSYGAIAYSPSTGSYGWAHDFGSQNAAENAALDSCYDRANDCQVAVWFRNACGALAVGPNGWGAAWAVKQRKARRDAVSQCSNYSANCSVAYSLCSPN